MIFQYEYSNGKDGFIKFGVQSVLHSAWIETDAFGRKTLIWCDVYWYMGSLTPYFPNEDGATLAVIGERYICMMYLSCVNTSQKCW